MKLAAISFILLRPGHNSFERNASPLVGYSSENIRKKN